MKYKRTLRALFFVFCSLITLVIVIVEKDAHALKILAVLGWVALSCDSLAKALDEFRKSAIISARYKIVEGSQSAHCCFIATVVDTTKPKMINGEHFQDEFESVCECFEEADAVLICNALNGVKNE